MPLSNVLVDIVPLTIASTWKHWMHGSMAWAGAYENKNMKMSSYGHLHKNLHIPKFLAIQ